MKEIKKEFISKIENVNIRIINYDYELKLKDLTNLKIEYENYTFYVYFDVIWVQGYEELVKIDMLIGNGLDRWNFNRRYEDKNCLLKKVTLSNEIKEYLKKECKKIIEER
jgi:hypothetical protein